MVGGDPWGFVGGSRRDGSGGPETAPGFLCCILGSSTDSEEANEDGDVDGARNTEIIS